MEGWHKPLSMNDGIFWGFVGEGVSDQNPVDIRGCTVEGMPQDCDGMISIAVTCSWKTPQIHMRAVDIDIKK